MDRDALNSDIVNLTVYTVGITPIQIALGRPGRRSIVFSASGNEAITVGLTSSVVAGQGLQIQNTIGPQYFERPKYAPFVVSAMWAVGAAAGGTLTVLEIVDNP